MIPIVTPAEMAAIDTAAPEPVEVLIGRAGSAVARTAIDMLGGTYGRRVVVLAGKGNNGNDGRRAAHWVTVGARVAGSMSTAPALLPRLGSRRVRHGFRGSGAPDRRTRLAVDIEGADGLTGVVSERGLQPRTVTFAALKPACSVAGALVGEIEVVDIALDVSAATAWLVTDATTALLLPPDRSTLRGRPQWVKRPPGMTARRISTGSAARSGLRPARHPWRRSRARAPEEVVGHALSQTAGRRVLGDLLISGAVVGPGLGRRSRRPRGGQARTG